LAGEGGHLVENSADDEHGRQDALFFPDLEPLQHLVELDTEAVQAFEVIARFEFADQRVHGHHEVGQLGLDAEHLVERVVVEAKFFGAGQVIQEPVHDVGGKQQVCRLRLAGITAQDGEVALQPFVHFGIICHRGIREPGVVTVQAELFQDAEHGQQLGAFEGKVQEGARVEQLDAPRLAPDEGNHEPGEQQDKQDDQDVDDSHEDSPLEFRGDFTRKPVLEASGGNYKH
jgi:hypothetical protein